MGIKKENNQTDWTIAPDFRQAFSVLDFLCIKKTVIVHNHSTWVQGHKWRRITGAICLFYLRILFVRPLIILPAAVTVQHSVASSNHFWHYWFQLKSSQTSLAAQRPSRQSFITIPCFIITKFVVFYQCSLLKSKLLSQVWIGRVFCSLHSCIYVHSDPKMRDNE